MSVKDDYVQFEFPSDEDHRKAVLIHGQMLEDRGYIPKLSPIWISREEKAEFESKLNAAAIPYQESPL